MGGFVSFDPFSHVRRIAFELSNRCVYAAEHALCPAHKKREEAPRNLPGRIVRKVLEEVRTETRREYAGFIYFHLYNEPLADPRLLVFVQAAHSLLPKALIQITTSGWNLDQVLLAELGAAGVRAVRVSIYSDADLARIRRLRAPAGLRLIFSNVAPGTWKNVLRKDIPAVYDGGPAIGAGRCLQPLRELAVTNSGLLGLCCMDWGHTITYGDLGLYSLGEIFRNSYLIRDYLHLSKGGRLYDVCKRCRHVD